MEKERKIRCDCGTYMVEKEIDNDGILSPVTVCPKCRYKTFTTEQAKKFIMLRDLHKLVYGERKIIQIGNSKGITLPEELKLKVGQKIKTEALTPNSFKVILPS